MRFLFLFILFFTVFSFQSCKKDVGSNSNDSINSPTTGEGAGAAKTPVVSNGSVELVASWQVSYPFTLCLIPYKVTIGAGYTSGEVKSNTFFSSKIYKEGIPGITGGVTIGQITKLEVNGLKPGIYYYKAIKESNGCTARGQTPKTVEKTGSFTIKSSQKIEVKINLN
jgi:hypothetical protein